ncbi:MAG: RNA polymerase sigma factor [Bacteroidales bacterium]|nr:RNA polymerase sigma factor [Bacteroidales bacterium]
MMNLVHLNEQMLAKSCSEGNKAAEEELYRRYAVKVFALCRRYLRNDDDAKDLMLETLIQALGKIDSFKYTREGSLYGWIRRIAINKALNQIKRHRWRMIPMDLWTQDNIPEPTEDEVIDIPNERILAWITELPESRRTVFNLHCVDGYSHKEISQTLGITETASTSLLAKARKTLKQKIRQYLKEHNK